MNKLIISGNLTRDVELAYSSAGKAYTKFSVAVRRPFKKDVTDFFNVTAFGKVAELMAEHTAKGSRVMVVGYVTFDKKDDKQYTNVIADEVEWDYKREGAPQQQPNKPVNEPSVFEISEDSLPF